MPKINNNYFAPTWANDEAPAIDETELQAISDTLELTNLDLEFSTGTIPGYPDFPSTAYNWRFAYGDGIWVGVSSVSDAAIWSDDGGQTWTETTMPLSASWKGVAYGSGMFVACNSAGSTRLAWSSDGKTWYNCTGTGANQVVSEKICFGNGVFVVVGTNGSVIWSDDPPRGTWTLSGVTFGTTGSRSLAYGNGVFVSTAVAAANATYSTDNGATWSTTNSQITGNGGTVSAAYGNGVFVTTAVGSSQAAWSSDGETWTAVNLPATTYSTWSFVLFGCGRFLAGESTDGILATSTDGKTWTMLEAPVSGTWNKGAYGDSQFMLAQNGPTTLIGASILYKRIYSRVEPDVLALLESKGYLTRDVAATTLSSTVGSRTGTGTSSFTIACGGTPKAVIYYSGNTAAATGGIFFSNGSLNLSLYPTSAGGPMNVAVDDWAPTFNDTTVVFTLSGSAVTQARYNSSSVSYQYIIIH